ncbi:MAG: sulfotransferase domain-containing protein [Elainellaceae cyanobacterium]
MKSPNFLIIGAAKSGTTTLSDAFAEHPDIYMSPIKETNFFSLFEEDINFLRKSVNEEYLNDCVTDMRTYEALFQEASTERAVGEASPSYLYFPKAAQRIRNYNSNIKLIAVLRNPVDRAYSNFLHHVRDELETESEFYKGICLEQRRIDENWWWGFHYIQAGLYYKQLKVYFDLFDRSQIKIYLYDDLAKSAVDVVQDAYKFIGVNEQFEPNLLIQKNVTGVPKNKNLNAFLRDGNIVKTIFKPLIPEKIRKAVIFELNKKNLEKPNISSKFREELIDIFREDTLKLQTLINRDLSSWLDESEKCEDGQVATL